jgi:hypothetical protein
MEWAGNNESWTELCCITHNCLLPCSVLQTAFTARQCLEQRGYPVKAVSFLGAQEWGLVKICTGCFEVTSQWRLCTCCFEVTSQWRLLVSFTRMNWLWIAAWMQDGERWIKLAEDMVLRGILKTKSLIFGLLKRQGSSWGVMGKWRRLHNKELYAVCFSPNIIRVIK